VYDIKDHAHYKFRPGHIVVRVAAGSDEVIGQQGERAAAGQVLTLGIDGRIKVLWADETTSFCYPQELYLISEEVRTLLARSSSLTSCFNCSGLMIQNLIIQSQIPLHLPVVRRARILRGRLRVKTQSLTNRG
jgi:hypothetical protein